MGKKDLTAQELRSLGGKARAKKLSAERRREIARLGGLAAVGKPRKRKGKKSKKKDDTPNGSMDGAAACIMWGEQKRTSGK